MLLLLLFERVVITVLNTGIVHIGKGHLMTLEDLLPDGS